MRSLVRVQDGPLSGGIAQLVERLLCKQDVSGSSPLTSTTKSYERVQQDDGNVILLCSEEHSETLDNCIEQRESKGS